MEGFLAVVNLYREKRLRIDAAMVCRFCALDGAGKSVGDDVIRNSGHHLGGKVARYPPGLDHVPLKEIRHAHGGCRF